MPMKKGEWSTTKKIVDITRAAELYQGGANCEAIGREMGCSGSTISKRLQAAGLKRTISEARRRDRFNESFFDNINTEAKAYWLGFLLADGCVRTGRNTLQINLKAGDRPHLEKFRAAIESAAQIGFAKHPLSKEGVVSLVVTSTHMTDRLRELGIVANAKRCFPPSGALARHFWRGCVDGDGTLLVSRARRKCGWDVAQPMLGLCGTKETIEKFVRFAKEICGTNATAKRDGGKDLWQTNIHGPLAKTLADHLWSEASVCLDRKRKIQESFPVSRDRKSEACREMVTQILTLRESALTHREIGMRLGLTEDGVRNRLLRAGIKTGRIDRQ